MSANPEVAYVTSKGRVVIPAKIRRKFGIKTGIRLIFQEGNGRLVVQPVTKEYISSFRGIFKLKPGEKSAVQELLADRAKERARGDRNIEADRRR
ncbi:MAG: AbrB/MazE/SpoVT family DNA-binding domain-containing protein [Opitutaceae bacterium]|nr:AbrB/MazE/SpoVT family DNA-binding domain-containing protein [Opitutaceae bacterium]